MICCLARLLIPAILENCFTVKVTKPINIQYNCWPVKIMSPSTHVDTDTHDHTHRPIVTREGESFHIFLQSLLYSIETHRMSSESSNVRNKMTQQNEIYRYVQGGQQLAGGSNKKGTIKTNRGAKACDIAGSGISLVVCWETAACCVPEDRVSYTSH